MLKLKNGENSYRISSARVYRKLFSLLFTDSIKAFD